MKIICIDNFDREIVSDRLIAENVPDHYAEGIAEHLNEKYSGTTSPVYFKAVPDDYKLYTFEP